MECWAEGGIGDEREADVAAVGTSLGTTQQHGGLWACAQYCNRLTPALTLSCTVAPSLTVASCGCAVMAGACTNRPSRTTTSPPRASCSPPTRPAFSGLVQQEKQLIDVVGHSKMLGKAAVMLSHSVCSHTRMHTCTYLKARPRTFQHNRKAE